MNVNTDFQDLSRWWLVARGAERQLAPLPNPGAPADLAPEHQELEALARRVDAARSVF
jgi:hypothetical protein